MHYIFREDLPDAETYRKFRAIAGWDVPSLIRAKMAMSQSMFGVLIYKDGQPVGMARVIGDGVMNVYIQDVIVHPDHRTQGHATHMVSALIAKLKTNCDPAMTVGLMAAVGQERLYSKFGFIARPNAELGPA